MRAPFNALVIPFYRAPESETLYCVLRRADAGFWQWVAGGGEDAEMPVEAAIRETREEERASKASCTPSSRRRGFR